MYPECSGPRRGRILNLVGLPPGLRAPAAVQTAMVVRDPVGFFRRNRQRFGPVFEAHFVGVPGIVYVGTPALADQVLRTDRDIGEAGTARKDFLEPLVGTQSVLCLEGDEWMRERRRLAPAFHGERVRRQWTETIAEIVAGEVADWPLGKPFQLRPRMQRITLEVILRVVFGFGALRESTEHDQLRVMLPHLLDVGSNRALAFVPPRVADWLDRSRLARRLPINPVAQFGQTKAAADALLYKQIARRRQVHGADQGADVLSLLISAGSTDQQIRDELITLLTAGHETTATAITWMFERLLRTPTVLQRVQEAVASSDDGYLDATVKEALRIRPVVLDAPRVLNAPLTLDGYEVPAGWYAAPVVPLVHNDPDVYPDPSRFEPERFLDQSHPPGSWIPFGGSRRMCLGIQLALLEMRVVLTEVLRRVRMEPVGHADERPRLRGVTLVPEHLGRVTARPIAATVGSI
jgi:cytochrome P450 family 135